MKKVLKVIAIILFVSLAVGVAGWLFYKLVIMRNENKVDVVALAVDNEDDELIEKINTIHLSLNADGTDTRLQTVITTINKLNSMKRFLGEYYVVEQVQSDQNLKSLTGKMEDDLKLFNEMYEEYNIKKQDANFPKHYGGNDIFHTLSNYIVNYSRLILSLNAKVQTFGIERKLDVEFSLIDLYANVSLSTYSNLNDLTYNTKHDVVSYKNLNYVNSKIGFVSGNISGLLVSRYSQTAVNFGENYSKCNAELLASTLVDIVNVANESNSTTSNENAVGYLLVQLLGR